MDLRSRIGCARIMGAALVSGLAPVLAGLRSDVNDSLKVGGHTEPPVAPAHRTRAMLVVSEVALAAIALVGAGLFGRSFENLRSMSPGFDSLARPDGPLLHRDHRILGRSDHPVLNALEAPPRIDALPSDRSAFRISSRSAAPPDPTTRSPSTATCTSEGEAMTVNHAVVVWIPSTRWAFP